MGEGGGHLILVNGLKYVFFSNHLSQCLDVHYIEFFTERMFMEPTLNSKVPKVCHCYNFCTFIFDNP